MNPRSTGKGMMVVACVLALGVMTMFFSSVEESRINPNQSPNSMVSGNVVEVPLLRNRAGHYVVTGRINGQDVDFLLDTGATDVVVPERIAERLGLPKGRPGRAMTANGPVRVYATTIDHLTIGDIELHEVDASVNPAMGNMAILLGMSALGQVEFIQQGDSLTLRQRL